MKFKNWINSLSLLHMMALAYQCSFNWKLPRAQLAPLLVKSERAKWLFKEFNMDEVSTGKVDYYV